MSINAEQQFFLDIMKKGMTTALNDKSTEQEIQACKDRLNRYAQSAIKPEVDRKYASASFKGTKRAGMSEEPIYDTVIYPSGRGHCTCLSYLRGKQAHNDRPCTHITALAKIGYFANKDQ